jgi:arylsulfatase
MPRKFTGRVGRTIMDTEFDFEEYSNCPEGAPNIVYILLDDMGFAALHCYGSNIETPNIDRLAREGLRYNNFHTTAVCSATRCSLLTGANHHAAGIASLVDWKNGTANGIGHINPEYGTIAEILKEYDYSTFASGKWHLTDQYSEAGPYDTWPLGKGFDKYYGFLTPATDQYHPPLVQDNTFVPQPKSAGDGYHVSEDITDKAIKYVYTQKNAYPDKPFFLYLAYGATHAPHHAPKEYIDRYKGKFDKGWDAIREEWFANQKELGVIPEDAELTERAPYVDAWEDLTDDQKAVFARQMEAYAGFLTHTDDQIGRLIDYLESIDQLDNTVVVFLSDKGASSEGGKEGRFSTYKGGEITSLTGEAEFAKDKHPYTISPCQ